MDIFLFIVTVGNIQGVLSCIPWTFPEDVDRECCRRKEIDGKDGKDVYLFLEIAEYDYEWKQFDCINYCIYYKQDDPVLNQHYCFKQGGNVTPKCSNGSKKCNAETEVQEEYDHSIAIFRFDLERILRKFKLPRDDFKNYLKYVYQFTMNVFSPAQVKVLKEAPPCDDKCSECFEALTDSLFQCYEPDEELCKNTLPRSNATCQACACYIAKKCQPGFQCHKEDVGETLKPPTNPPEKHSCDRNCSGFTSKTCVFNFTLNSQYSDTDGPRVDGRKRLVLAYNGQIPGPPIVICEGDKLVVNVTNGLTEPTTLHFHGFRQKNRPWSDGVPNVSQCGIKPNKTFVYGFDATDFYGAPPGALTQAGTYWYHSHYMAQRTDGAYGPVIIRPRITKPETRFEVDESNSTITLQEWYESNTNKTPRSLLINGNGHSANQTFETNYTVYNITKPGKKYLFRVIAAISEDAPMRLSIEGHNFTAIAADSQDIQPVEDLTHLWIAGGERFHIVVQTKTEGSYRTGTAYKIKVLGEVHVWKEINGKDTNTIEQHCTTAWLKYPGQTVDRNYRTPIYPAICTGFDDLPSFHRTINPVPNHYKDWKKRLQFPDWKNTSKSGNIYIADLRGVQSKPSIIVHGLERNDSAGGLKNTNYLELIENSFNRRRMNYSGVPILLQNESYHNSERCGRDCELHVHADPTLSIAENNQYLTTTCSDKRPTRCENTTKVHCLCEHVMKQPYAPGYWADTLLINNLPNDTAHPIHIHGGWFWVMAMGQYPFPINASFIQKQNEKCPTKDHCLWTKNITLPVAKDTIQVPTGGYVLLRTPLDNRGAWFMHCHINKHLLNGMAMVMQIGGFGDQKNLTQNWCTGPLEINGKCNQD